MNKRMRFNGILLRSTPLSYVSGCRNDKKWEANRPTGVRASAARDRRGSECTQREYARVVGHSREGRQGVILSLPVDPTVVTQSLCLRTMRLSRKRSAPGSMCVTSHSLIGSRWKSPLRAANGSSSAQVHPSGRTGVQCVDSSPSILVFSPAPPSYTVYIMWRYNIEADDYSPQSTERTPLSRQPILVLRSRKEALAPARPTPGQSFSRDTTQPRLHGYSELATTKTTRS
jgi:hypothetical protein